MHLLLVFSMVLAASLPSPNGETAREPQLAASGSEVALVYGAGHSIFFSGSTDGGKTFAPAVEVAEGEVIPLSRHRGPRVAVAGSTVVVTAVVGKTLSTGPHAHGLPSDGDLIAWRSVDSGKTWSKGVRVNDVEGASTEGLHTLAVGANGRFFAFWLDKRSAKGTKLFGASSTDGGKTWSKNVAVYESPEGTICECCHPSAAVDAKGQVYVMWRNWLDGSRDMYMARSQDGVVFSKPEKLGTGTWKLNACPMDGGGIAASASGVMTAWRRDHDLYLDRPGAPEVEVGQGTDVALSAGKRGVYVIWSSPSGVQVLAPGQTATSTVAPQGSFPAIAALANGGAIAAWESAGKISIQTVP
ncbi:MAG TPA: sialidase family protein [Bryobacteraceae bacterium]|jgi:hypothetical protein